MPKECATCAKEIEGKALKIEGVTYHKECFVCCECRKIIEDDYDIHEGTGLPCHPDCKTVQRKTKVAAQDTCAVCGKDLEEGGHMLTEGKGYHKACFKCTKCGEVMSDGFLFVKGSPFHMKCHTP
eukprot:NODE_2347_length_715_cov_78.064565_g1901_i0.p2 GENE.NODE_2347_length_715_cov_78.064565_g1901_i0~~NODE_2347_length_715_cov_78.064565_g1901_i0.p2  ORF type:complete len:125 (+),score=27.88 NODE_2347_length_715_cov_78.064565_g1901_i0:57-431(+)